MKITETENLENLNSGKVMAVNSSDSLNIAAIDIGSNSIHGLISEISNGKIVKELYREKRAVRLGAGLIDGIIKDESIKNAVDFLKKLKSEANNFDAVITAAATSAVREAKNQDDFLDIVLNETGIEINVISGTFESELIYKGVCDNLPCKNQRILIIDIGGGSTELIVGENDKIIFSESLKIGAVRTSNIFFENYSTPKHKIQECKEFLKNVMLPTLQKIKSLGYDIAIGTSGTIQAIGKAVVANSGKKIPDFLNNFRVSSIDMQRVFNDIENLSTSSKRAKIPGIEPNRADIITAGELILQNFLAELRIPNIIISSSSIREGLIIDTYTKMINK